MPSGTFAARRRERLASAFHGAYEPHAPYYFLTLVFHDQSRDISERIEHLKRQVVEAGFPREHAIHCAPLVRREDDYKGMDMDGRRRLFQRLYDFARICDIRYKTFVFEKREYPDHDALVSRMSREVGLFVRDNLARAVSATSCVLLPSLSPAMSATFRTVADTNKSAL